MGELLDALNAIDKKGAPSKAAAFCQAGEKVSGTTEALRAPWMVLEGLSRWTCQAPLQALAIAFLIGVMTTRY